MNFWVYFQLPPILLRPTIVAIMTVLQHCLSICLHLSCPSLKSNYKLMYVFCLLQGTENRDRWVYLLIASVCFPYVVIFIESSGKALFGNLPGPSILNLIWVSIITDRVFNSVPVVFSFTSLILKFMLFSKGLFVAMFDMCYKHTFI